MEQKNQTTKFRQPLFDDSEEGDIDVMLKKELNEAKLEYRFADYKKTKDLGGMSRSGWIMYRRKSKDPILGDLADASGFVRRGTLVLVVKPREKAERKRAKIKAQNEYLKRYNKNAAEELANDAGKIGSQVVSGFEKNM